MQNGQFFACYNQSPYIPTFLQNVPSLVLQIFLYLEAFECNTNSNWLNRTKPYGLANQNLCYIQIYKSWRKKAKKVLEEWLVNMDPGLQHHLTLSQTSPSFYMSAAKSFENTAGKGEIACYEQFLLFLQCFLTFWRTFCHFIKFKNYHLQTISIWKGPKCFVLERVNVFLENS